MCPLVSASVWLIWTPMIPSLDGSIYFRLVLVVREKEFLDFSLPRALFDTWSRLRVNAICELRVRFSLVLKTSAKHIADNQVLFQRNQSTPARDRTRLSTSEIEYLVSKTASQGLDKPFGRRIQGTFSIIQPASWARQRLREVHCFFRNLVELPVFPASPSA